MKNNDTHLDPSASLTTQPPAPQSTSVNPEVPVLVTDAEANQAAKELGMTFFNAEKTKKLKKIGLFRAQQGVVHLGVGRLAACDEALQKLMEAAVTIASTESEETSDRVGAILAGKGIVEVMQKGIQMEAEFQVDKLIGGEAKPPRKRSFDTDQPIVPIQANAGSTVTVNYVDGTAPSTETK